jgi:arsenate reductase
MSGVTTPTVLFVCVHNAGRSQMAAGYLAHLADGQVRVLSAGSEPADELNPVVVEVMAEEGIDIGGATPQILTAEAVEESDVVVTMGCGGTCPFSPGTAYEDWDLEDPAGKGIESVRLIRDEIKRRVTDLLSELVPTTA